MRICSLHIGGEKYEENLAKNDDENEDQEDEHQDHCLCLIALRAEVEPGHMEEQKWNEHQHHFDGEHALWVDERVAWRCERSRLPLYK